MAETKNQSLAAGFPVVTLGIISASMLAFIIPGVSTVFIFDRHALMRGELWRFFTSHLVHFSKWHIACNILAFGIAGCISEGKSHLHFTILCLLMAPATGLALFILKPGMHLYGGLSGIACGVFFYCALGQAENPGPFRHISLVVLFCLPLKIIFEFFSGSSILPYWNQHSYVVMPESHMAGILTAFLYHAAVKLFTRQTLINSQNTR